MFPSKIYRINSSPTLLLLSIALIFATCVLGVENVSAAPDLQTTGAIVNVKAIAAGGFHSCALTQSGGVKCWGDNTYGQLGDGTTSNHNTPTDVVGLTSGVAMIALGSGHSCAVLEAGGVKCWGINTSGQLGDGTTNNRAIPVDVSGLNSGVAGIAAGLAHTCAWMHDGSMKCWGDNAAGQLGDGSTLNRTVPVNVSGLNVKVDSVATGAYHTCALMQNGGVKCWGGGQTTPLDVAALNTGVTEISAGAWHTCALMQDSSMKCWGANNYGQLGDGTQTDRSTPVDAVELGNSVAAFASAVSGEYNCVRLKSGGVKCWGDNTYGQLGDGTAGDRVFFSGGFSLSPVSVHGLSIGVIAVATGTFHACALLQNGAVKCWGRNSSGQLGDGTLSYRTNPADVIGLGAGISDVSVVSDVSAGSFHTCAIVSGVAKCWGMNDLGGLGDGTVNPSSLPIAVSGLNGEIPYQISAGLFHSCAIMQNATVKCWGSVSNTPVLISGLDTHVLELAIGADHTCARLEGGSVKCWGRNETYATTIIGLESGVTAISSNAKYLCALLQTGGVKCMGIEGVPLEHSTLNDIPGLTTGVTAIAAGDYHGCALLQSGGVKCWGDNGFGQLGDGTTASNAPVSVVGLSSGVSKIFAGRHYSCALLVTGSMKCWGENSYGQLGDGTTIQRTTPVDVIGVSNPWKFTAGWYHACVREQGGALKCWGENESGQLGYRQLWEPVDVVGLTPTLTISGHVRYQRDNTPIKDVTVIANGVAPNRYTALTDANGFYQMAVPNGTYLVEVSKTGITFDVSQKQVLASTINQSVDFTGQDNISINVPTPPPPNEIVLTPFLSDPNKKPIVLVHGWNGGGLNPLKCSLNGPYTRADLEASHLDKDVLFPDLIEWLENDGFEVYNVFLTTSLLHTPTIAENGKCLAKQIDNLSARLKQSSNQNKITIIAHSMGGLVTRECLAHNDCKDKVDRVITLGTPHNGTPLADDLARRIVKLDPQSQNSFLKSCSFVDAICQMSVNRIGDFNDTHPNLAGINYMFIGGDSNPLLSFWPFPENPFALIPGDGFVGAWSGVAMERLLLFPYKFSPWTETNVPTVYFVKENHTNLFKTNLFNNPGNAYYQTPPGKPYSQAYACIRNALGKPSSPDQPLSVCRTPITLQAQVSSRNKDSVQGAATTEVALEQAPNLTGAIQTSQTLTREISVDAAKGNMAVTVYSLYGHLDLKLIAPDGSVFDKASQLANVQYFTSTVDGMFPPSVSFVFSNSVQSGIWQAVITAGQIPEGATTYALFTTFESSNNLNFATDKTDYRPGERVYMTATLSTVTGTVQSATIVAAVALPGADKSQTITFTADSPQQYKAGFTIPTTTANGGFGNINVRVDGVDAEGTPFSREASKIFTVVPQSARFNGLVSHNAPVQAGVVLTAGVSVNTPTTYTVVANLYQGGALVTSNFQSAHLQTGEQSVSLPITNTAFVLTPGTSKTFTATLLLVDNTVADFIVDQMTTSMTITRAKSVQSITFAPLPTKTYGDPSFPITPTATSGLPVTLSSLTTAVCTISGNMVTLVGVGTCTIRAEQAGDGNFNPAPSVERSFEVKSPDQPEIGLEGNGVAIASGDTTPSLSDYTDFDKNVIGTPLVRIFTIRNTGSANLTVGPVTINGANASDFVVTSQPVSPVAANGNATFQIRFMPSGAGVRTATVSLANNDSDENPYTFAIQGVGLQSLQPTSQLTQLPGYTQSCVAATAPYVKRCTLAFTLKNTSGGPLQIRYEQLTKLSSHVYVLNGTPNPGQVGAVVSDVRSLAANATFLPTFQLGLKSSTTYSLFFKVYGYPGAAVAAGTDASQAVELGEFAITISPDEAPTTNVFLPLVNR